MPNKEDILQDGGQALVKSLENQGIEYVFGLSGGAALPIFDALVATNNEMKFVLVRHETDPFSSTKIGEFTPFSFPK